MTDTPEASSLTDRELLEFAAKAVGMEGWRYTGSDMSKMIDPTRPESTGSIGRGWNPLTDSGDALQLAVKLGLFVDAGAHVASDGGHTKFGQVGERDPYAATRRAIVRAAAAIGRAAA